MLFTSSTFSKNKMALLPGIPLHERLQPHVFKAQSCSILSINVHQFETVKEWEILKRDHRFGLINLRPDKAHTS
ncbi:hypothetical protein AMTRI_Chr07g78840 [Amborella trichopoda]